VQLPEGAYSHAAGEAGYRLDDHPAVQDWIERVESQSRFVNDLEPYPENARRGKGTSIYG